MIQHLNAYQQTLLGTLFTWSFTAFGAALVYIIDPSEVMLAASYWSLLAPALELAERLYIGIKFPYLIVAAAFLVGALFVERINYVLENLGLRTNNIVDAWKLYLRNQDGHKNQKPEDQYSKVPETQYDILYDPNVRYRGQSYISLEEPKKWEDEKHVSLKLRRLILLILAITLHNIPEGLVVGVSFASVHSLNDTDSHIFDNARNLAVGIAIQNFPEGLAVSLPMKSAGFSNFWSFWCGQMSGVVEPVAGLLGVVAVQSVELLLPFALAFAAGAMVFVVLDDLIPEAHTSGHGKRSSLSAILGFVVMMTLDVGFG